MNIFDDIEMWDNINKYEKAKKGVIQSAAKLHSDMSEFSKTINKQNQKIKEMYKNNWCEDCIRDELRRLN